MDKIEKLHKSWLLLNKNKFRDSNAQRERENDFVDKLDSIFDIAHANALTMMKIDEDRRFLEGQRNERKMAMTAIDKPLALKQERSLKRKLEEEERMSKSQSVLEAVPSTSKVVLLETSDRFDYSSDSSEHEEYKPKPTSTSSKKFKSLEIINNYGTEKPNELRKPRTKECLFTSQVTSALDRNKVSDREALRIMMSLAAAFGQDPSALPISRSSIQRARKKGRENLAKEIKESFKPDYP